MSKEQSVTFIIPGLWKQIREMRTHLREMLASYGDEIQNAAEIAASELVENAVKYGAAVPAMPEVRVMVDLTDTTLTIRVANGSEQQDHVRRLEARLTELASGRDPLEAYLARLEDLSRGRPEHMGLGIYRIAAEGGFSLSAVSEAGVLTVTAERPVRRGG
jgi:hypothetical protein